jgi:methanogenic corrinoid protein MtbC1
MEVVYLGANVPDMHLISTVHRLRPWLVVLIAQQLFTAANLADMADLLAAQGVRVAYGGRIFATPCISIVRL